MAIYKIRRQKNYAELVGQLPFESQDYSGIKKLAKRKYISVAGPSRRLVRNINKIGTPVGQSYGEAIVNGASKAASAFLSNPTTSAVTVGGKVLMVTNPKTAAIPFSAAIPGTLKMDKKIVSKLPGLKKVSDKIQKIPKTKIGKSSTRTLNSVITPVVNILSHS